MTAASEIRTEERPIWSGAGRGYGPEYGEVYRSAEKEYPGYIVVTRSNASQSMWAKVRYYKIITGLVTDEQARKQAIDDASART